MECFCSMLGLLKTEKCSDSDFFFPRKSCTLPQGGRVVMRGDLRITFWRGIYVSCIIQRIFILSGLQADIFITEKTFSLLKSMEKAPEGPERVLPKFLKLKLFYYMPHSCEVAFRKPVGRYSPFCQTATLFPLAKVDVSWRLFSELPGKQTSLADKYRWLTYLFFCVWQVFPVVHILSHAWLEQIFLGFKRKVVTF